MKLFIFLLVIGSCTVQVFSLNNYNDIANALRTRAGGLIQFLSETRNFAFSKVASVETMDFNIRNEKSIAPVQKALDQKAGKNGVQICKKSFENALTKLLENVRYLAVQYITNILGRTSQMIAELQSVLKNLQGPALGKELDNCKTPSTCNLTGSYAKSADDAETAIKTINKDLLSPTFNLRLDQPTLSEIENDVVKPTNACLAPL